MRGLKNLSTLGLGRDKIADWGHLKDLANLNELNMDDANIGDSGPLKDLKNLHLLSARDIYLTSASIEELQKARPNLYLVW